MPRTVLPAAALVLAALLSVAVPAPSNADDQAVHHVKYTISAENPVSADIYYRDTEPPTWADYSHNPYAFSPKVRVDIGPDDPWVLDVTLSNPDEWAMVTVTDCPRPQRCSTATLPSTGPSLIQARVPRARSAHCVTGSRQP
jgi:hypothetical protein